MSRQGDSFTQIYRDHRPRLEKFLAKRGLNHADREDIIQESFLRTYQFLEAMPAGQRDRYLIVVARNLHTDMYRHQKKFLSKEADINFDSVAADPSLEYDSLRRSIVEEMLAALVEQKASRFFKMYYYEGHKIREIASKTNTAEGTVAANIYRFRCKYKKEVDARLAMLDAYYH